ncbi:MAG: TlpA family protein disulfide reductase [Chthonomonadales bacterium]|nr:TlpA family protein disulfide reductase [Chthonomonadales bacterium]
MKNPLIIIGALLGAFVLFVLFFSPPPSMPDSQHIRPEGPAPMMRITTPEGKSVSLADQKGKVVLVKFWATWCGPCAMSTPSVEALYKRRKDQGFEVIGVALEHDDGRAIPEYVRGMGVTYTVGMADPPESVGEWLPPNTGIPTTFLVDKKGRIRWSRSGFDPSREHEIEEAVDILLKEAG